MYALYIGNKNYSSWSMRPWTLMRQTGIAFEERLVRFETQGNFERFRAFSPTGKVPCLIDGDMSVWDSLAISEYLAERHAGLWPDDGVARAWARSATAEMHSGFSTLRDVCNMNCGVRAELLEVSSALLGDLDRIEELWSEGMHRFGGPFLAGNRFTIVDSFFAPVAARIRTYGLRPGDISQEYAERLLALESVQEWYEAALAEDFRDEAHDAELKKYARVLEDMRK